MILINKKSKNFKKRKKNFNKNNFNIKIIMTNIMLRYQLYRKYRRLNQYLIVNYNSMKKKKCKF